MRRLGFLLARMLGREAALAEMALPLDQALGRLRGRVALVGNARGLAAGRAGPRIDAADLVVRINRAPMPAAASHGARTDVLALATGLAQARLDALAPGLIFWLSPKRKRLPYAVARHPGFVLPPRSDFARLQAALAAPPSTGLLMMDLLARSPATRIDLHGFDFFETLSLSGSRTAASVPHDFAAERGFAGALIARDPRFVLHA